MMLYPDRRNLRLSLRRSHAGRTGQLVEPKARDEPIWDNKLYSRNGIRPRDADGQRFKHSAVHGMKAVRSRAEDAEHAS
jgi:hypothetical protein